MRDDDLVIGLFQYVAQAMAQLIQCLFGFTVPGLVGHALNVELEDALLP